MRVPALWNRIDGRRPELIRWVLQKNLAEKISVIIAPLDVVPKALRGRIWKHPLIGLPGIVDEIGRITELRFCAGHRVIETMITRQPPLSFPALAILCIDRDGEPTAHTDLSSPQSRKTRPSSRDSNQAIPTADETTRSSFLGVVSMSAEI